MPPVRKQRRHCSGYSEDEVPWYDMPENALYKVFECLLQDKQGAPAFRSAAACCRSWRLASMEVVLDDTAASRPELPPMLVPEVEERKPTTATTCNAGVCDEAESETEVNGFEASSREQARRRAAGTMGSGGGSIGGGDRNPSRPPKRPGRSGRGAAAPTQEAARAAGPAVGRTAAAIGAARDGVGAGESAQVTPGSAQRRRVGAIPPPPPAPLRHALDHPVFNTGAAPESAAAAAAAIAAVDMPRRLQQQQQQLHAGAGPSGAGGRPCSLRRGAPDAAPAPAGGKQVDRARAAAAAPASAGRPVPGQACDAAGLMAGAAARADAATGAAAPQPRQRVQHGHCSSDPVADGGRRQLREAEAGARSPPPVDAAVGPVDPPSRRTRRQSRQEPEQHHREAGEGGWRRIGPTRSSMERDPGADAYAAGGTHAQQPSQKRARRGEQARGSGGTRSPPAAANSHEATGGHAVPQHEEQQQEQEDSEVQQQPQPQDEERQRGERGDQQPMRQARPSGVGGLGVLLAGLFGKLGSRQ